MRNFSISAVVFLVALALGSCKKASDCSDCTLEIYSKSGVLQSVQDYSFYTTKVNGVSPQDLNGGMPWCQAIDLYASQATGGATARINCQ